MKKLIISGSCKLQKEVNYWVNYFKSKNYEILDYPDNSPWSEEIYKRFYRNLENTDILFLMNEDKNGIKGYIGSSAISEVTYAIIFNLIHNKNIEIYILNMPSKEVPSYDEVMFWLDMGWVKLFNKDKSL